MWSPWPAKKERKYKRNGEILVLQMKIYVEIRVHQSIEYTSVCLGCTIIISTSCTQPFTRPQVHVAIFSTFLPHCPFAWAWIWFKWTKIWSGTTMPSFKTNSSLTLAYVTFNLCFGTDLVPLSIAPILKYFCWTLRRNKASSYTLLHKIQSKLFAQDVMWQYYWSYSNLDMDSYSQSLEKYLTS